MSVDEGVLEDGSPDVTTRNVIANLENRGELPLLVPVERRDGDTAGNVNGLGDFGNRCQGTLDTIVDTVEEAGPSSTESGLPVRATGSPIVTPAVSS